jgi:TusA-related sulfurtransferase
MAHSVMPFDISKTVHVFRMTDSGGVLKVVATEPGAKDQIALIRQHLQHEAKRFQQGDYSDPKKLHGADMPGLKELQAGVSRIQVSYAALPDGAAITFKTSDLHLITAVHRWFGAQLSEHGADARAE